MDTYDVTIGELAVKMVAEPRMGQNMGQGTFWPNKTTLLILPETFSVPVLSL